MAWGFVGPSHFGEFFPDGDYVGWQEAIREHYDTRMTPEEKAARVSGSGSSSLPSRTSSPRTWDRLRISNVPGCSASCRWRGRLLPC